MVFANSCLKYDQEHLKCAQLKSSGVANLYSAMISNSTDQLRLCSDGCKYIT